MNSLHSIHGGILTARVWAYPLDMRGHHITGTRNNWNGVAHSYLIQRGTPPALGEFDRRYWYPWSIENRYHWTPEYDRDFILRPPCGPIRSQSREPHLGEATPPMPWYNPRLCQTCLDMFPETAFLNTVRSEDEYTRQANVLSRTARTDFVDPVTGL